ncbi:hypothetical protein [Gaoshiqia sediminis]|uniref:Uncharacterized protein n=1 Tax=Gaoshiqia sediminis TaxID=2986998 RepID=A0AA41Y6X0_9BACT|nr:hypothetical protein [Gaoshiqia sediminis]MCW0482970.1 hypothetical protein [Gaoshiqia sediminis]
MKFLASITVILFLALGLRAQESKSGTIVFEGFLMTEDSIPLENALLINYRTYKMIKTNQSGYFKTSLSEGDSLMINHVSMIPQIVLANRRKAEENKILVAYRTYLLDPMTTTNYEKEQGYLEETTKQIKAEIEEQILIDPNKRTGNDNQYDDDEQNPGATIIRISPKTKKKELPKD